MPPRGCGRDAVGMRPRDVVEMWLSLRERLGACAVHHPPQLPLGEARGRGAAGGVAAGQGLRAKRRASPRLQRGTDGEGGGATAAPHTLLFLRCLGALRSAVSSGVPNGPYSGPVYSKAPPARVASCLGLVILLCAAAHRQPRVPRRC